MRKCIVENEGDPANDDLALLKVLSKSYDADLTAQLRVDVRHENHKTSQYGRSWPAFGTGAQGNSRYPGRGL